MYLEKVEISGFRNIKERKILEFNNSKNLLFGPNGCGKTSILEAVYILAFGRSFLSVKKEEMINIDSSGFFINSNITRSENKFCLSSTMEKSFSLFLDNEKTSIAGAAQNFFPLFFSSSDYTYTISSVSELRRLFDRFIFGTNSLYSAELIEFKRTIRNKSHILRNNPNPEHLKVWNDLLVQYIKKITLRRFDFISTLNSCIKKKYCSDLEIRYKPSSNDYFKKSLLTDEIITGTLRDILDSEIRYKKTLVGPHLDRHEIFLEGRPLRLYSSGEKKLNLFFIYLAFIDIFHSARDDYPVFLVDDYDIAMDEPNTELFISKYPSMQVIATSVRENINFDNIIKLKP